MKPTVKVGGNKRILWVTPRVPWPPACGASVANVSLMRLLTAQGWQIDLMCIAARSNTSALTELMSHLRLTSVSLIPTPKVLSNRWLRYLALAMYQIIYRHTPLTAIPFVISSVREKIVRQIAQSKSGIVLWDGLHPMAACINEFTKKKELPSADYIQHVYRAHNVESEIWRQYHKQALPVLRPLIAQQLRLMKAFEERCLAKSALLLCLNKADVHDFKRLFQTPAPILEIPVFISRPRATRSRCLPVGASRCLRLLWIGGMNWWPNKHGIQWFLRRVWPQLSAMNPNTQLDLVGSGTESIVRHIQGRVHGHGFVATTEPYLTHADILIVPIFFGSGIRIKALEALTHSVPCFGTPHGLSGIPEQGCWLGEDENEWVKQLSSLSKHDCVERGRIGHDTLSEQIHSQRLGEQLSGRLMAMKHANLTLQRQTRATPRRHQTDGSTQKSALHPTGFSGTDRESR